MTKATPSTIARPRASSTCMACPARSPLGVTSGWVSESGQPPGYDGRWYAGCRPGRHPAYQRPSYPGGCPDSLTQPLVTPRGDLAGQAMQVDEALGLALVEGVAFVIGGQAEVGQAGLGATTGDDGAPAVQRHPDVTGDVFLGGGHERVERALQRAVPQTVVGELAPLLLDATLVAAELTLDGDVLQLLVGGDQGERTGCLVDLTALDADQAVLDQVE